MSARCSPRLPAHLLASVDTRGPTSDRTRLCRTPVEPRGSTLKRHSPPDQPIVELLPPGSSLLKGQESNKARSISARMTSIIARHKVTAVLGGDHAWG